MYLLKDLKKIRTYFNGLLPAGSRDQYNIRFSVIGDTLLSVMQIGENTVKISIPTIDTPNSKNITNCVVSFDVFYNQLGKIKGVKEVDLIMSNDILYLKTENEELELEFTEIKTRDFLGEKIADVSIEDLTYAFSLNTSTAKTGVSDFDNNIILLSNNNKLFLGSYTIGAFVGNELENNLEEETNFSCILPYSNSSFIKKWLKYAGNPKNIMEDILEISIMNTFMELKIDTISVIFKVDIDTKLSDVFYSIFNKEYETEKELEFEKIRDLVSTANKDKMQEVSFNTLNINASIYRPLFSDIVYQLSDADFDINVKQLKSKFDTLILETETHMGSKTKILTFLKTNV